MTDWQFENTKDTPLGRLSSVAADKFRTMNYEPEDFYEHFACFLDAKHIGRFLSLFECYKQTLGVAGHIAEVGVFRGAVSLLFAKLSMLYEPHTLTQVHGFDLFDAEVNRPSDQGLPYYIEPYQRIRELIDVQGLQRYVLLHQIDVATELAKFFAAHSHLHFKLVLLDAGVYEVVKASIEQFWPRLSVGGIMIFDQFNHEVAPGEATAVRECLPPGAALRTFPNGWMPTAYVIKEA